MSKWITQHLIHTCASNPVCIYSSLLFWLKSRVIVGAQQELARQRGVSDLSYICGWVTSLSMMSVIVRKHRESWSFLTWLLCKKNWYFTSHHTHHTNTQKLHWLPIKQRIDYKLCLLTYKTLTNQQPTYLYNSLSFPSHFVSTRSSVHSFFPFLMSDHHLAKGISLSLVHDSGIHYLLIPETRLLYQYSVPSSKHTSSKLHSLRRLFPISLDCLPGFWFLLFSFYALSNDT